jgi:hypothetical protein
MGTGCSRDKGVLALGSPPTAERYVVSSPLESWPDQLFLAEVVRPVDGHLPKFRGQPTL